MCEDYTEPAPKKFEIMADYGGAYIWDEDCCTDLRYKYTLQPSHDDIKNIEVEFEKWVEWFESSFENSSNFPWEAFNSKGISLAKKLAKLLENNGIQITYSKPPEDKTFSNRIISISYA